jgi:hypothetical protein
MRCIVSKKRREIGTVQHQRERMPTRAWDTSSRAHFCADAATGAGAIESVGTGANVFCSESSGGGVSLCASTLSRTGLVAVFAGEVDSDWWVTCVEACGMLRLAIRQDP